jgi:hypothetical protein
MKERVRTPTLLYSREQNAQSHKTGFLSVTEVNVDQITHTEFI